MRSRSRRREDGAGSSGKASTIGWAVQAAVGCSVTLKWTTAPAMVSEHDEDEEHPQARGGDREEIERDQVRTWLARKLRQVWDGGVCRMLGLECLAARSRLFQNGRGLGPAKASGARHRPTPRRREHGRAQRGEDDHQGTGKPGTGPD